MQRGRRLDGCPNYIFVMLAETIGCVYCCAICKKIKIERKNMSGADFIWLANIHARDEDRISIRHGCIGVPFSLYGNAITEANPLLDGLRWRWCAKLCDHGDYTVRRLIDAGMVGIWGMAGKCVITDHRERTARQSRPIVYSLAYRNAPNRLLIKRL